MAIENNNQKNTPIDKAVEYLRKMESDGCTISDLIAALERLSNHTESSGTGADVQPSNSKNLEVRVSEVLKELGMPRNILGFRYARTAIILAYKNPNIVDSITRELYPQVAKLHDTTPLRAERAIRHAIEAMWSRCDTDVLYEYFGNTTSSSKGKATNSEFIAMLADYLRLHG